MPVDPGVTRAACGGIGCVFTELRKRIKEWKNVRENCNDLMQDSNICVAFREDVLRRDDGCTKVVREYDEQVRELVHDIQDCLERFEYRLICKDEAKWLARKGHAIWTWRIRHRFAKELKHLKKRVDELKVRGIVQANVGATAAPAAAATTPRPFEENPVGIHQAKQELLTLLNGEGHEPARLRVIAVVGFGGSGKTTLARAAYQSAKGSFELFAWVNRAGYQDACGLLKAIFLQFWEGKSFAESSNETDLQDLLKRRLMKRQRYLIVLDDMNMEHWEWIEKTFHDNGRSSRIMVTVRTLPAANDCSSNKANCNGYVYQMRTLGDEGSKRVACLTDLPDNKTQTLRQKCDGLPLALVSVSRHFRTTRNTMSDECETLCKNLGSFLNVNHDPSAARTGDQREPFADLQDVLMSNYTSLPSWTLRDSLLYLGIFPDARHLKRNKITRRWVAEGYAAPQEEADKNFEILIDKNIIQPVGICTSYMCKAQGIMHEFVLHKSMSENFIRTFDGAEQSSSPTPELRKRKFRHFVVRGSNAMCSRAAAKMDLSHIRSMTVLRAVTDNGDNLGSGDARQGGEVGNPSEKRSGPLLKFSKYKMIRVLDLEECAEVENSDVETICKLWNLRYLSLGNSVKKVPKKISQLKLLETLHLSKTEETELPANIIHMAKLIHLSGKLMLPESEVTTKLGEESKSSNLETLSGIVASRRQGFLQLMPRMKKLRKVKICFGESGEPTIDLSNPIKGYLERELERTLGLDFSKLYGTAHRNYPKLVMEGLDRTLSSGGSYYLTTLKLHLRDELVSSMPQFIFRKNLDCLKELCLSLTSVTKHLLSDIAAKLHMLVHLKLKADTISEDLVIQEGKFQMLESLCFEVKKEFGKDGSSPQIRVQGILPELRSFQFLCKNLADLCVIDINRLKKLQEIELHGDVSVAARQQWETAARNHPKRPNVLPFLSVDDPGSAAIPAAGAVEVVHDMPAPVAAVINTPEGSQQEGHGLADNHAASTSTAADEPHHGVPDTAVSNGHGLMPNKVDNDSTVKCDDEIVPVANGAEGGDEPTGTEVVNISAPANGDSPHTAKSVASATHEDTVASSEHGAPNMLIPNNIRSESSININNKGAPDATNHTAEHNASSSGHAVHAG